MVERLVSIMVPCYNGELFLERFFSSVLSQTYKKIHIILVNDGSTDNTSQMIPEYEKILSEQGMELQYIEKPNGGQASAINAALPYLKGEFCMWFDCDDFMTEDHIEKKVNYLQQHPDCDVVMCRGHMYKENDLITPVSALGEEKAVGTLFEDLLYERRRCTPGLYMVRTQKLLEKVHNPIYEKRGSQNMQLLLPISLDDNIGFIDDKLFNYVIRDASFSHQYTGGIRMRQRIWNIYDVKMHVLETLPVTKEYYDFLVDKLELFVLNQRINAIDEQIIQEDLLYVEDICQNYLSRCNINNRKVYIWGYFNKSINLKNVLDKYAGINCCGYIESDSRKCDSNIENTICYKDIIDSQKMFLIIPLAYHADIVETLEKKGFIAGRDYFYPKYELRKEFKAQKHI